MLRLSQLRQRRGPQALQPLSALLGLALSLSSAPAFAAWDTQSPKPTHLDIRGIAAPSAQRVYLATSDDSFDNGGALFESTDGGSSWAQRNVPSNLGDPHYGLFFLDSQNGWAFGNQSSRTTDGGTTWTTLPLLGSTYFMEFYTPTFGIASGNFEAYVSYDAGDSWAPSPNDIFQCDFIDSQVGLGISASGIYRTTDGGASFALVQAGEASSLAVLSANGAVAIVNDTFLRSTNGGLTWTTATAAEGRDHLLSVSSTVVLAWGRSGTWPNLDDRMFRSGDGGQTWTDLGEAIAPDDFGPGLAFSPVNAQIVVGTDGAGNMFQSTDAGLTWDPTFTSPGPRSSFLGSARPVFVDGLTGYFGYGEGFVIKTTDAGSSWRQISSGTGQSLNDIDRLANGKFFVVGEYGTLLTSDGTSPWALQPKPTQEHLMAVDVIGGDNVVLVDRPGRLYRSSDGGDTWTSGAAIPVGLEAYDIHFTTLEDGWLIGSGFSEGALFHTTNGGDSWQAASGPAGLCVAVDFVGTTGWAANITGLYFKSTNNGATWTSAQMPGGFVQLADMDFFDANTGYAVGAFGYAARTTNGGATWQLLPTPNSNHGLTDIHFLSATELWVSTNDGVVYHSSTGGQSWSVVNAESDGFGIFACVYATPEGDVWTAGFQGYLEHFSGSLPPPVNQPPVASFDFAPLGLSVTFTDTSTDPDGVVASWAWDFGDGTTSTEQHPTHVYASANTYIVYLTVVDDDGDPGTAVHFIVAQPGPGGTFGDFTEVTPLHPLFVTPQDEDFWVATTSASDYDNDGDLDVAVLGYYVVYNESVVERLILFRNDGASSPTQWTFTPIDLPIGSIYSGASDLAWGDVDGDGDQDLALGSEGVTAIYRNEAGSLVMTDTVLPGYWEDNSQSDFDLRSITWVDFDNDADLDLLIPSVFNLDLFEYTTALMRNDGPNGTGGFVFSDAAAGLAPTSHAQSAWADFDNDQDMDLLLANLAPLTEEGFIRRYRNDGGVFVGQDILGTLTIEHGEVQWGDYDADGDLDILVAGHITETDGSFNRVLRIYRNDAETYVPFEVISCPPCDGWFDLTAATWADYDSDGDMDILLTGTYNSGSQIEGRAKIFANNGGVFTDSGNDLPAPRASGTRGGTFSWLDLDGEGDLDYFIAGEYFVPGGNGLIEAQMHAYRNDVTGQNLAPSAPSGLNAVVQAGGTALLTWNAATDDLTPAAALTYDLDLYRNGVPTSLPRRLPEPGDVSTTTDWLLTDLPNGSYTWALRAVDSAYNGGPFALGTFRVTGAVDAETNPALPREYAFEPSFPNPFRNATSFQFALPEPAKVDLAIYDVQGRLVKRLLTEDRAPGHHRVIWDARGAAAGTYFVKMSTPAFTKTQRVLLLK